MRLDPLALSAALALAFAAPAAAGGIDRYPGSQTEAGITRMRLSGTADLGGTAVDLAAGGHFDPVTAGQMLAAFRWNDRLYVSIDGGRFRQSGELRVPATVGGRAHAAGAGARLETTLWHALGLVSWLSWPKGYLDGVAGVEGAGYELSAASVAGTGAESWHFVLPQCGVDGGYEFTPGLSLYAALFGQPFGDSGAFRATSATLRAGFAWRLPMARAVPGSDRADWTLKAGYESRRFSGREGDGVARDAVSFRQAGPRLALAASF